MDKLFLQSTEKSPILRNMNALMPEYGPPALLHRERHLREIADALNPALKHAPPQNLLIHGPTGTGKTSCARHVLSELSEYSSKVACIYINCWESPSKQAILSILAENLSESLPRRGLADDEIFQRIIQRLKYEKKTPIIVLDEVDRLMHKNEAEILYNFSRANENYQVSFGIIGITNVPEIFYSFDERMRSSLRFKELRFEKYSPQQLKDILAERAKIALFPGACSLEALALCAAHGAKNGGDARVAIETLMQAGLRADNSGKSRIDVADVKEITGKSAEASLLKNERLMGENERMLLNLLMDAKKEGKTLTSGELYSKFNSIREKKGLPAISERQIMNYVQMFEAAKMITAELSDDPKSKSGKTKLIRLIR
ncbi:MAG: AAA family ATPase [Candidatus Micrarchaeota archaeon]